MPPLQQVQGLPQKSAAAVGYRYRNEYVKYARPASAEPQVAACFLPSRQSDASLLPLAEQVCEQGNKDENQKKSRTFMVCLATVNGVLASGVPLRSTARRRAPCSTSSIANVGQHAEEDDMESTQCQEERYSGTTSEGLMGRRASPRVKA